MLRRYVLNPVLVVLALWTTAAPVAAQDVTVTPLASVEGEQPPDQLPQLRKPINVKFPEALKNTSEVGYVVMEILVDGAGRVDRMPFESTLSAYRSAFGQALVGPTLFTPAKSAGKAVPAFVRMAVIFNPASAAVHSPDSTPRLLDATAVVDPQLPPRTDSIQPKSPVVWATVGISETGDAVSVSDVAPATQPLIESALGKWRFAPARRGGQPVAASLSVPFIVVPPTDEFARTVPRKVIRRVPPVYPVAMRDRGIRGEVLLEFTVDANGRVKDPRVVRSLNPYFNEAALAMIRQWRYEPAAKDGSPPETRMQQMIGFSLGDEPDGGSTGVAVRQKGDLSKLPEDLRYDVPPKALSLVSPIFPYELLRKRVAGSAQVGYVVSSEGRVVASTVNAADHPEFGLALQAAVELFVYEAAVKDGQPIRSVTSFHQLFRDSDGLLVSDHDKAALDLEEHHPEKILKGSKLDGPVVPTRRQQAVYPASLQEKRISGEARIDFLVDEAGRVCLPRIVSATEPVFGYAAVQAAAQWQFKPPMSGGKPAVTRVRVPFLFTPPVPDDSASAGLDQ